MKITFPDGRICEYEKYISGYDVVKNISINLAKKTTSVRVNGVLQDIYLRIEEDCDVKFITNDTGDQDCLEILRHDAAHMLAQAVKEIYKNDVQITIGPNIENGFYYDIACDFSISMDDLVKIEAKMQEISMRNLEIKREVWKRDDAIAYFNSIGETYKAQIIADLFNKEKINLTADKTSICHDECVILQNGKYIGKIHQDCHDRSKFMIRLETELNAEKILQCVKNIISGDSSIFKLREFDNSELIIFGISEAEKKYYEQIGFEEVDFKESARRVGFKGLLDSFDNFYDDLPDKTVSIELHDTSEYDENIVMKLDIVKFSKFILDKEVVSIYKQGDFIDLCRGPHAPYTGMTKFFKLLKVSGAYWRGDSKNEMLQRIYGTAWHSKKALDEYLLMLEESEKRDHRKLGLELDLFHIQEEAVGSVFWHPNGWTIYLEVENYIRQKIRENGYVEVKTPQMIDKSLWEKSGHWEKFQENMFVCETEDKTFAIKPMNCPAHIQIFNQGLKSYKDLPLRMAEFGCCHRNEPSGALHGIMRVRSFTQDDAHIFCTENQIESEAMLFCKLLFEVYEKFGFNQVEIKLSTRPEKRSGNDETWDKAEKMLGDAIKNSGYKYEILPGEGAFYGPKLEFQLKDAIGRKWQCGTLQLDFVLPERLGAKFINQNGEKETPVILHRAILGSLERFIGMLIEHHAGKMPFWLSPVQIAICTITNDLDDYGSKVLNLLKSKNIRAIIDTDAATLNAKIRNHSLRKIPYIGIIGKKEVENDEITIRQLGSNQNKTHKLIDLVDFLY